MHSDPGAVSAGAEALARYRGVTPDTLGLGRPSRTTNSPTERAPKGLDISRGPQYSLTR